MLCKVWNPSRMRCKWLVVWPGSIRTAQSRDLSTLWRPQIAKLIVFSASLLCFTSPLLFLFFFFFCEWGATLWIRGLMGVSGEGMMMQPSAFGRRCLCGDQVGDRLAIAYWIWFYPEKRELNRTEDSKRDTRKYQKQKALVLFCKCGKFPLKKGQSNDFLTEIV